MKQEIEIKTFDGDYNALQNLLRSAWKYDYSVHKQPVMNFSIPYLKWNLESPSGNRYFHIGAYHNGKLIGFAASFPQSYEYITKSGKTISKTNLKGVLSTYFTTHQDYRRMGIGTMLAKERIRRHIEQGVEINLFYQDHGHASSKVYPKFSGYMNSSYSNLRSIGFLIKVLDIKSLCKLEYYSAFQSKFFGLFTFLEGNKNIKPNANQIRKFRTDDIDTCLNIINSFMPGFGLFRRWSKEELLWELENELSTTYVFLKNEIPVALISYHILEMTGRTEDSVAQVDNIFIDALTNAEKRAFIHYVTSAIKKTEAKMILIPELPYFKTGSFYRNLYIPFSRKQHLKLLNYTPDNIFDNCSSIYTYYR